MANTSGAPPVLVAPLLAAPPRSELSLVGAALKAGETREALGLTIDTWEGGVTWRPENVGTGGIADPCNIAAMVPTANLLSQTALPIFMWEMEKCTAGSQKLAEAQQRAVRLLEATTSGRLAKEVWRGDQAVASGWSNPFYTRTTAFGVNAPIVKQVASGASLNPIAALAALEQAIAQYGTGARGMIHCTRRTATVWASEHLVAREGGLLLTTLGNIVVADGGYDGSAPGMPGDASAAATGVTQWAYATGIVQIRLSDIEFTGEQRANEALLDLPDANTPDGETIVRANAGSFGANDRVVVASRYGLAIFDPAILAGAKIDHSLTLADTTHWSATLT